MNLHSLKMSDSHSSPSLFVQSLSFPPTTIPHYSHSSFPATGHRPPATTTGHRPPGHRPPATGHRPPATGHQPPATGHRPRAPATGTGHRPGPRLPNRPGLGQVLAHHSPATGHPATRPRATQPPTTVTRPTIWDKLRLITHQAPPPQPIGLGRSIPFVLGVSLSFFSFAL